MMILWILIGLLGLSILVWWANGLKTICPHCGEWKLGEEIVSYMNKDGGTRRNMRKCSACGKEKITDKILHPKTARDHG